MPDPMGPAGRFVPIYPREPARIVLQQFSLLGLSGRIGSHMAQYQLRALPLYGTSLDFQQEPMPMRPICGNGNDRIYVCSYDAILCYDIHTNHPRRLHAPEIDFLNCALYAEQEQLWVGSENRIYECRGDSLRMRHSLPHPHTSITALCRSQTGTLLAALHRLLSYAAGRTAEAERNRESGAHALFHQYLTRTPHAADTYHRTARTLLPQSRKLRQRNREHRKYLPECPKHATDCL